jgi:hypothetical protein
MKLSTLTARLMEAVPSRNNVPSALQYQQCVKDAVSDFSRRAPVQRISTVHVVHGTAEYDLPDDFIKLYKVVSQFSTGPGVLNTPNGLVPFLIDTPEKISVSGARLLFYPTPAYTLDREVWYGAAYRMVESEGDNEDGDYQDLTDDLAAIVMKKAQALALIILANKATQEAWSYSFGDESVTKTGLARDMREQAALHEAQYTEDVKRFVGQRIVRGGPSATFRA